MKNLFIAVLLTLGAVPAFAYTHIANGAGNHGGVLASVAATYTTAGASGDLRVACVAYDGSTSITSGMLGGTVNTWTFAWSASLGSTWSIGAWYSANITAGAETVTFTPSSSSFIAIVVDEYSGIATSSPLDQASVAANANPSITTTAANEMVYSCQSGYNAATMAAPWTMRTTSAYGYSADALQATAGTISPNWTVTNNVSTNIMSFKLTGPFYTISGATSGYVKQASSNITWTPASSWAGSCQYSVSDGLSGAQRGAWGGSMTGTGTGTFTPGSGSTPFNAVYTPAITGPITLTFSNNCSETDPVPVVFTSNAPTLAITGCTGGNILAASSTCTATSSGHTFTVGDSITLNDGTSAGTFTPPGSPEVGPLIVAVSSGTTITFTYTPLTVGARLLSAAGNWSFSTGGTATYTAAPVDASTFTATANGNSNAAGTWTCSPCASHTTPRSGDTLVISGGFHVTVPAGVTLYAGSCPANNTTWDLTITPSGSANSELEVQGTGAFWFCGNMKYNGASASLIGVLKFDTGSTFYWDENNGSQVYRGSPAANGHWNQILFGSSGDTCTFGSSYSCPTNLITRNYGSAYPTLVDANGTTDNVNPVIYGTAIVGCGTATLGCINYESLDNANSYPTPGLTVKNSVFDTTSSIQSPATGFDHGSAVNVLLDNNRIINSPYTGIFNLNAGFAGTFQSCQITRNFEVDQLSGGPNSAWGGCTFDFNAMAWFSAGNTGVLMTTFRYNVPIMSCHNSGQQDETWAAASWIHNTIVCNTPGPGSMHATEDLAMNASYVGNICFNANAAAGEGHCGEAATTNDAFTITHRGNISLIAASGTNSGVWETFIPNGVGTNTITVTDEHNGWYGAAPIIAWGAFIGHPGSPFSQNQVVNWYRSNLFTSATVGAANYPLGTNLSTQSTAPLNNFLTSTVNHNLVHNGLIWTGQAGCPGGTSTSNSTYYFACTSSTGAPGSGDVTADPKIFAIGRNPLTWAGTQGQPQTLAGLENVFEYAQDLSYTIPAMYGYIVAGMQPTNLAIAGTAHDGVITGVTGTFGSGYTGTCTAAIGTQNAADLGTGAAFSCTVLGNGSVQVGVSNGGANYLVSSPAPITVTGTTSGAAASLAAVISASTPGPVQITQFIGRVAP